MVTTAPKTKATIRKQTIAAIVKTLDEQQSCYCGGHGGRDHDVNPPCDQIKRADAIYDSIKSFIIQPEFS